MSVYLRGGVYWAYIVIDGVRYRRSSKTSDYEKAKEFEDDLFNLLKSNYVNGVDVREADNPMVAKIYHAAKRRAKIKGIEFSLTKDQADKLFSRAGTRCELTGLPFSYEKDERFTKRPFVPSLDRIDSSKGYIVDNCRIVCLIANIAVNEWGEDIFKKLAYAYNTFKPQRMPRDILTN